MADAYETHRERVAEIAEKVEEARKDGEQPTIYHGSSHSTRPDDFEDDNRIHVERLNHFIDIDPEGQTVLMEPDISMRQLVEKTLEHDLIPYVVPEFPEITVGGAIQGGAGESSCFRYGGFGNHCDMYEIVTGAGDVVEATPETNEDLFHGTFCSYGSMGIMTEVEMNLRPAQEYVALRYIRIDSFQDAVDTITEQCNEDVDFIDGILFSDDRGVIMVGELTDQKGASVSRFTRARDEWFYLHADSISKNHDVYEETIPIRDYLFRYDIGGFWAAKYAFGEMHLPFNRVTRTLLHPLTTTSAGYDAWIHSGNFSSKYVFQDIVTAHEDMLELLEWVDQHLNIYPLWLLPIKPQDKRKLAPNFLDTDVAINIGIWGKPESDRDILTCKKNLEEKTRELEARKTLYAQQFYSEEEFRSMYDMDWYRDIREKYNAEGVFPSIYEVTHVDELPSPSYLNAVEAAVKSALT